MRSGSSKPWLSPLLSDAKTRTDSITIALRLYANLMKAIPWIIDIMLCHVIFIHLIQDYWPLNAFDCRGLILQDLTFVHIGNNDFLPDGNINFGKRWQQYNILDQMRRFRNWYAIRQFTFLTVTASYLFYFAEKRKNKCKIRFHIIVLTEEDSLLLS